MQASFCNRLQNEAKITQTRKAQIAHFQGAATGKTLILHSKNPSDALTRRASSRFGHTCEKSRSTALQIFAMIASPGLGTESVMVRGSGQRRIESSATAVGMAALTLALSSATASAAPDQGYLARAPEDEVVYFLLPDRFANGDPANDRGGLKGDRLKTGYDPTS
jgi:hypothetical protein